MSIILEALKKATKREPVNRLEAIGNIQKPGIREITNAAPDSKFSHPAKTLLISLSTILAGGILLFLLIKFTNATILKSPENVNRVQGSLLPEEAGPSVAVEGYAPPAAVGKAEPSIFKIRMPNPRLTLNGIIYGIGRPAAIIENKILEEGASIKGVKVVKIYNDRVELLNETSGEIFTLKTD